MINNKIGKKNIQLKTNTQMNMGYHACTQLDGIFFLFLRFFSV